MIINREFKEGMWTPDVSLLLLEPTAIMIIAIAEQFEYEPTILSPELIDTYEDKLMEYMAEVDVEAAIPEESTRQVGLLQDTDGLMSPIEGVRT